MDAGWIAVVALSFGVSLDGMPVDQAEQVQREAARSLTDDLFVTGVVLPHVGDPATDRHTTFQPVTGLQPVTGGQLESGFAQAGSGTNAFGQALQQSATDAQRAFGTTQQQFNAAANETQRTIGGEVRAGASRFLGRAGDALEKTGDAIGGTARRFRDGIRNVLPGRNDPVPQVNVAPPAPSGFPAFPSQQPTTSATAPIPAPSFGATAPVVPLQSDPLPTTTPAGTSSPSAGFGATTPAGGFLPQNTQPVITSATTPVTNPPPNFSSPNFSSPVVNNQQPQPAERTPVTSRPFQQPAMPPVTTNPTTTATNESKPFFDATNSFGQPSSTTTPVVPPAQGGFLPSTPQIGDFANTAPPAMNQNGFGALPNQVANQQQLPPTQQPVAGFNQPGISQPGTTPWFNASAPAVNTGNPLGQTVGRPANTFGQQPPAGPGTIPGGQLSPPFQTVGQQPGPGATAFDLPQTPQETSEPWRSLVLATLVAVGSVGGNLFLGWSYLDARNKYRSALRRTTQAFGRASLSGE